MGVTTATAGLACARVAAVAVGRAVSDPAGEAGMVVRGSRSSVTAPFIGLFE